MKIYQFGIISILLFMLIGCNLDDENGVSPENDDVEDTSETTDSETDDSNNESNEASDGEVLSLGETGKIETNYGDFEITFESFRFLEELDGTTPSNGVYVLVDASVKNTGDKVIEGDDFYTSVLVDDKGLVVENSFHPFESINRVETLKPGESSVGQFVFNRSKSETYELIYNYGFAAVSTEVTWKFSADEASNE